MSKLSSRISFVLLTVAVVAVSGFFVVDSVLATNLDTLPASDTFSNNIKTLPIDKANIANLSEPKKKLGTDLLRLIDSNFLLPTQNRTQVISQMKGLNQFVASGDSVATIDKRVTNKIHNDLVYVYVSLKSTAQTTIIDSLVWKVTDRDEKNHLAVALVDVNKLEVLASLSGIRSISSVLPPVVRSGSVVTEGDIIHKTTNVRSAYSQSGSGIKIGIISDGVDHIASAKSTGDLPAVVTVLDNSYGGDEGTAMLEIIYDMAPDAQLFFHAGFPNAIVFNNAVDDLVAAGVNIIIDDLGFYDQPYFEDGTGTIASHIASVLSANNIVYVSAAGNDAQKHYQGFFNDNGNSYHDFSAGLNQVLAVSVPNGGTVIPVLQWDDSFGSSSNDYDLYLYNQTSGALLSYSLAIQNGNDNPIEKDAFFENTSGGTITVGVYVKKYSGVARTLELNFLLENGALVYPTNLTQADSIFGHPAVPGVIAVGAVAANDPGNDTIESFSSQGPVTIIAQGQRVKPDIIGIDRVAVTGAGGFSNPFPGTSAAAPAVAAIAAQLWGQYPSATGNQIRDRLLNSAVDLGASGVDTIFGHGRADSLLNFQAGPTITSFNFTTPAVTGVINESTKTIAVTVPFGTNITALVPTVAISTGTSISPLTGVAQDFTSPVIYTATSADGLIKTYTVTVNVVPNSAKAIIAFSFAGLDPVVNGVINEGDYTVALTVPFGTDIITLVPTITVSSGASVSPLSGIANNFTTSQTYTVTAANLSTQDYVVTVAVALNPAKAITAFDFTTPVATGVITEATHAIAVTVPFGTAVTALTPTITITGASVNPASGVAQDFTSPATYTVTATDSSTQAYTVTVITTANNVSGNITTNTTWTLANSPYIVTGTVQVLEGATLTIEPGVTVKFNTNTGLNIGGELIAEGTVDNIITFTSNSSIPKAGDWIGIKFFNTATDAIFDADNNYIEGSIFRYSNINYSGYSGSSPWAIYSDNTSLFIDNNIIEDNYYKAVYILGARSKITNNIIRNNYLAFPGDCGNGIVEIYSSQNIVKDNTITNNGINGFIISNSNNNLVQNNSFTYNACGIKLYGANNIIKNNIMSHNSFAGIDYYGGSGSGNIIEENDIINNNNVGIYVYKYNVSGLIDISNNNIYGNTNYNLRLDDSIANIESKNNYWGTTDTSMIDSKIYDYYDNISLGKVIYEPYATAELDFDDQIAPTLAEITLVSTPTNDNTPNYTFSSNEAGTITYGGSCSSLTTSATVGNNTITFNALADGAYNNCTIKVTDAMGNESLPLNVSAFTVDITSPVITILGSTPVDLTVGVPAYVDAGATALDNGTVNLTGSIITTVTPGPVDTSATGTFTIHYNVSDAAGNPATEVTRTVNINVAPITLSSIAITTPATKLSYTVGNALDITGLVVTGTYSDASTKVETITEANVTGFDSSAPVVGQILTITVDGKTATYTVDIVAPISSAKAITAFSFTEGSGVINETDYTIAVIVPFGTNVTALIPTITITGASVNPASGVAQDFTNPVVYTVTAEDSTTQAYTVTVTPTLNSAKDITSFSFSEGSGVIAGTNIAVTVPFSTDVTALVPTIVITGDSVNPLSGIANNFIAPVTYTVTAADATTKVYTITVTIAPNTEANILSFNSATPVANGVISGTNITLTVPFGTSLVDLPITITLSTGASVVPTAGNTIFVDGVATIYTVTAQDGITTKNYSVTVNIAANTSKDITSFNFDGLTPNISGVISGTNITLNVPYGTDVTALVPTIGITGASVSPSSGSVQDFTGSVTYTVTAADASTQDYTVTVIVAAPSDLTALTAAIAEAQGKHDAAVEGNIVGQYPAPLKANLRTAIDTASSITNSATQAVVDVAVITLNNAVTTFEAGVILPDITAPVITLIGANPMNLTVGDTFTDPGATAVDVVDGSVIVITTGTVDTTTVGVYIITYTATDVATNSASATRTVNVVVAPVILNSIAITTPATKLSYTVGNALDITGLVVTGTYSDASTKVETITTANITGFNSLAPATGQVLTITVSGKITTYTVSIVAIPVPPSGGGGGYMPPPVVKTGDINNDTKVDKYDFAMLMSAWNQTGSNSADLNHDGKVDKYDFSLLMLNWNK